MERLKRALDPDDGLAGFERAREVLSVAALEGRHFTAEAVGDALAVDVDRPHGIVDEVSPITIEEQDGERTVWMYRFAAELDHMAARRSSTRAEEEARSFLLAEALVECYGAASPFVSATVARLFDAGGEAGVAGKFWRMTRVGNDDEVAVWRARRGSTIASRCAPPRLATLRRPALA